MLVTYFCINQSIELQVWIIRGQKQLILLDIIIQSLNTKSTLLMSINPSQRQTPKPKTHHYNLFQFEQKLSNKFNYNASRHYPEDYFSTKKQIQFGNIIDPNQFGYPLELITGEIRLLIYDEGNGNYPVQGSYVQYRKRMYYEGENKELEKDLINCLYGCKENSQPIELILSISKHHFKAKAYLGPKMSSKLYKPSPTNKVLVVQIQVMQISDIPLDDNFLQLERYHAIIIRNAIEGDQAFKNQDLQKSLKHYEFALEKMFNQYYNNTIQFHKKQIQKEEKLQLKKITTQSKDRIQQNNYQYEILMKNKHSVQLIEQYSQKIALKGIQVAFLAKQYLKVIKWSYYVLLNPKYDKNFRVLIMRSKSYLQLQQFDRAMAELNLAKMVYPDNQIIQRTAKEIQEKKVQFMKIMQKQQQENKKNRIKLEIAQKQKEQKKPIKTEKKNLKKHKS